MRSIVLRASAVAAAALCIASSGCGDAVRSTAPRTVSGGSGDLLSGLVSVSLLQRLVPLSSTYSASAVIGPAGGTIAIPQAGMSIAFPAGAVAAPTTVTATALAGGNVAYDFQPHGIVFAQKPVITQDLSVTAVLNNPLLGGSLQGAYFADDSQLGSGTAVVNELIPASVDLLRLRMRFAVGHFSGYAASSGRQGGFITSSNDRGGVTRPIR